MYAEQQLNAFQIVKELGLGIETRLDYNKETSDLVHAQENEDGIRRLMVDNDDIRKKRAGMKEKCRKALTEGGSSSSSIERLIKDMINNVS